MSLWVVLDILLFPWAILLSLVGFRKYRKYHAFEIERPDSDATSFEHLLGLRFYYTPTTKAIQTSKRVLSIHGLSFRGVDVNVHLPGFGKSDRAQLSTSQYGYFLLHIVKKYQPQVIICYGWSIVPLLMALGNLEEMPPIQLIVIDPLITHEYISLHNLLYLSRLSFWSSILLGLSQMVYILQNWYRKALQTLQYAGYFRSSKYTAFQLPFLLHWEQRAMVLSEYSPLVPLLRHISHPEEHTLSEPVPTTSVLPDVVVPDVGSKDIFTLKSLNSAYTSTWDDLIQSLLPHFSNQINAQLYLTEYRHSVQTQYFERLLDTYAILTPYHALGDKMNHLINH